VSQLSEGVVSFVIPVRNDADRLRRCLESIRRNNTDHAVELVVVDNGSEDDSAQVARRLGAEVICLPGVNVSTLRNAGVAVSRSSLLAFVDADHEIAPDWIDAAVARFREAGVGAIGTACHAPADGTWVQRGYDRLRVHRVDAHDTRWLGSGNLVVRRDAFQAVGGFDETLEVCEDVDLCFRLRRAGYRLVDDPALVSAHAGDPETLRALVKSEMWRSRNNVRVTLRSDTSLRSLVSLAIPILNLGALAALVFGAVRGAAGLVVLSVAATTALALLYVLVMLRRGRWSPGTAGQAFAVAWSYNLARALALVWPAKHRNTRVAKRVATSSP
jgi:GT2 family glycosyltransferase